MAQAFKSSHIFDYVIYGSDLSTQIIATYLSLKNKNTLLIEKPLSLGQFLPTPLEEQNAQPYLDTNLQICPDTELSRTLLQWLGQLLGEDLIAQTHNQTALTYHSGEFQNFLGFGERSFETMDVVSKYLFQNQIELKKDLLSLKEKFRHAFSGEQLNQAQITSIHTQDGKVQSVKINAQKTILTKNLIFCAPPRLLIELLEKEDLSRKNKQALSKPPVFSKIALSFLHDPSPLEALKPHPHLHILMGTKNDFEPTIGRFKGASSTWFSFFKESQIDSFEEVGALLRFMKKQIKRAYPDFFQTVSSEKITVDSFSQAFFHLDFKSPGHLDKLSNLKVFSPQFYNSYPFLSEIQSAKEAFSALELEDTFPIASCEL